MERKYDIVYADPPWKYDHCKTISRRIENQYATMDLDEIKALEIPTKEDAVLFLWATAPKLREALAVMDAWGFVYKTHAIWDKRKIGMGYWFRGRHELLLVGVKGKYKPPASHARIASIIQSGRTQHSRKPDEVREWIEAAFPEAEKIELFARARHAGWDSWGDEV